MRSVLGATGDDSTARVGAVPAGPSLLPERDRRGSGACVRIDFGISSFGINASEAAAGEELITAHDEASDGGQEELYVVTRGRARFVCDGEEVEIAEGGLLYVPAEVRQQARALQTPTVVLMIGGVPGKPFTSDLPG